MICFARSRSNLSIFRTGSTLESARLSFLVHLRSPPHVTARVVVRVGRCRRIEPSRGEFCGDFRSLLRVTRVRRVVDRDGCRHDDAHVTWGTVGHGRVSACKPLNTRMLSVLSLRHGPVCCSRLMAFRRDQSALGAWLRQVEGAARGRTLPSRRRALTRRVSGAASRRPAPFSVVGSGPHERVFWCISGRLRTSPRVSSFASFASTNKVPILEFFITAGRGKDLRSSEWPG